MAELNELFERASLRAGHLAEATLSAAGATQEVLDEAERLVLATEEALDAVRRQVGPFKERLGGAEPELAAEAATAGAALVALGEHAEAARREAGAFGSAIQEMTSGLLEAGVEPLASIREEVGDARTAVATIAERVEGANEAVAAEAETAAAALAELEEQGQALTEVLGARSDVLLAQLDAMEARARQELATALSALDALGTEMETEARTTADRVRARTAEVGASIEGRYDRDLATTLGQAERRIRQGMTDAERLIEGQRAALEKAMASLAQLATDAREAAAEISSVLR
jgi:hypothetical protein